MKSSSTFSMTRRGLLCSALASALPLPALSFLSAPLAGENRLVFVMLRGGMDGLYLVPAVGDPDFSQARGVLAQYETPPLPLTDYFALHPKLPGMHGMFQRGELTVVHATGFPYYGRSHFDAQNILETGGAQPFELSTGWLGRALDNRPAIALSTVAPMVIRGAANLDTWTPSKQMAPSAELMQRLEQLYQGQPALLQALSRAKAMHAGEQTSDLRAIAQDVAAYNKPDQMRAGRVLAIGSQVELKTLAHHAAEFLGRPDGPRVAVLEQGGWDSHGKQNHAKGPITSQMGALDGAMTALRDGLIKNGVWNKTLVVVATEFGRTVEVNGTDGTDHGTGGAAFVFGGGVKGGRVLADWPGLRKHERFEERDLRMTTDMRAVFRTALLDHLQIPKKHVDQTVLPNSAQLARLELFA